MQLVNGCKAQVGAKKAYDTTITFATKVKEFRLKICTTFGF